MKVPVSKCEKCGVISITQWCTRRLRYVWVATDSLACPSCESKEGLQAVAHQIENFNDLRITRGYSPEMPQEPDLDDFMINLHDGTICSWIPQK